MPEDDKFNGYRTCTTRAKWWDYGLGTYHVVMGCKDFTPYFGHIAGEGNDAVMHLSPVGMIAEEVIQQLPQRIPCVEVSIFQVMPNHIHALLHINEEERKLSSVIASLKAAITKEANDRGIPFEWQPRFYDVIASTQKQYEAMYHYIMNNVAKWNLDDHHPRNQRKK